MRGIVKGGNNDGGGATIVGQGEYVASCYENMAKGDLVTTRRYFGFDTLLKVNNPDVLPTGDSYSVAVSPDDVHVAIGHSSSPFLTIYKRSGDVFTKLTNPAVIPGGVVYGCAFSSNGKYLAVKVGATPYLIVYKRSGDVFTQITTTNPMSTAIGTCKFSKDSNYLIVSGNNGTTSGSLTIYKINATTDTFTQIYKATQNKSRGFDINSTGNLIACSATGSTSAQVFSFVNDSITELSSISIGSNTNDCAFSPNDTYLAFAVNSSPYLLIYKKNGSTYTKLTVQPSILPTGAGYACSFSPDGKYLSVAHTGSPYVTVYKVDSSTDTFTKIANPASLPTTNALYVAYANLNAYMIVTSVDAPYVAIYKADILGDYIHKYTGLSDLYYSNYINFGYAKSAGVAGNANKLITLPIK
ncbi:WD40 repeat protein [Clostridium pascui]|uniref:WD40 repeat domain-containing protein n=1 Tax=Clostridium pascui TaxID=46609 RepID=UPI001959BFEF|nr:WD40 repeat domain-containing protein [Clostridium pascui]MBM7868890.1 WD40 repeat protein [Clostridium pascui]